METRFCQTQNGEASSWCIEPITSLCAGDQLRNNKSEVNNSNLNKFISSVSYFILIRVLK